MLSFRYIRHRVQIVLPCHFCWQAPLLWSWIFPGWDCFAGCCWQKKVGTVQAHMRTSGLSSCFFASAFDIFPLAKQPQTAYPMLCDHILGCCSGSYQIKGPARAPLGSQGQSLYLLNGAHIGNCFAATCCQVLEKWLQALDTAH